MFTARTCCTRCVCLQDHQRQHAFRCDHLGTASPGLFGPSHLRGPLESRQKLHGAHLHRASAGEATLLPWRSACLHICTPVSWWLAACLTTFLYTLQGRVFTCRLCGNHLASNLELISKASRAPFHHCSHTPVCTSSKVGTNCFSKFHAHTDMRSCTSCRLVSLFAVTLVAAGCA